MAEIRHIEKQSNNKSYIFGNNNIKAEMLDYS